MKIRNIISTLIALLIFSQLTFGQDRRTLDTKVADLLAQMPANDNQLKNKLMTDMLSLGEEGIKKICDGIIPAGTGDDTKQRFAVESLSRYLSDGTNNDGRAMFERICIGYATKSSDSNVKDFFISQLKQIGKDDSSQALKAYLNDKENCIKAISAIAAIGGPSAEKILAESIKDHSQPCAASIMNALAEMNSKLAVADYIEFAAGEDTYLKFAAYNALARSGSPEAYPILLDAARTYNFSWERTGATASLLNYAHRVAEMGDLKKMDKICRMVIAKCNDKIRIQNKTAALRIYVEFHGINAMPMLFNASQNKDQRYMIAAINMTSMIKSGDPVKEWIKYFPKATPEAKPEILRMFGNLKSEAAAPLLMSSLTHIDPAVRSAAANSLSLISGKNCANLLVTYMLNYSTQSDRDAVESAWKSVAGNQENEMLHKVLADGEPFAKTTAIELMAWTKNNSFFSEILPFASSSDQDVRKAAFTALPSLAAQDNQESLIKLLAATNDTVFIANIQDALANASAKNTNPAARSAVILKSIVDFPDKEKLIPVLARTGGNEALAYVLKQFVNGNPSMKATCFTALTSWRDYSASSALFDITASGNTEYHDKAFKGYVRLVQDAPVPQEEKCLLLRKVMPFAGSDANKNEVLTAAGKLKTFQALLFVGNYLDEPALSAAAAKSAMYIALPGASAKSGLYGNIVRGILTKAVPKLSGPESSYDKEMVRKYLESMLRDEGFVSMFNGKDLSGWHGLVENPIARAKMKPAELAAKQAIADQKVPLNWSVKDGCIWFNGQGENLCSIKEYGDFEMIVDWKISKKGDSGIYLRGTPQVQIWDTSRVEVGAQVGSGGLYNNTTHLSKPLVVADNPVGDWNTFRILMVGEKVSVWLNGILVVDNISFENYWDHKIPIFQYGPVELQAHGTDLAFRDIYIREVSEKDFNLTPEEKADGFVSLFNGRNIDNWVGDKVAYLVEDGNIVVQPDQGNAGNLYTSGEYADFVYRFEFQLTPAANNGIGIRAPLTGDAAYVGMEIQVLDNTDPVYANLRPYQYHGSVYGVIPAKRDFLKPLGEWNTEEITAMGTHIKVVLNGTVIVDGDIAGPRDNGTMDHNEHPGLKNTTGHIGFLGHGSVVRFRNIRIKDLSK